MLLIACAGPASAEALALLPARDSDVNMEVVAQVHAAWPAHAGLVVQKPADTLTHVRTAAVLGIVCARTEPVCAKRIGEVAAVARVLVVDVIDTQVTLTLVDVRSGKVTGKSSGRVAFAAPEATRVLRRLIVQAVFPNEDIGVLDVQVNLRDAVVQVDERTVGRSPIAPQRLSPGRHHVYVTHPDVDDSFETTITLDSGETERVDVHLVLRPDHTTPVADPIADTATPAPLYATTRSDTLRIGVCAVHDDAALSKLARAALVFELKRLYLVEPYPLSSCNDATSERLTLTLLDADEHRLANFVRQAENGEVLGSYQTTIGHRDTALEPAIAEALLQLFPSDTPIHAAQEHPLRTRFQVGKLAPLTAVGVAGVGSLVGVCGGVILVTARGAGPQFVAGATIGGVGAVLAVAGVVSSVALIPFTLWSE